MTAPRHAEIVRFLGDGDHNFRLALGELRELQDKTGVGPLVLYRRLLQGEWRVDDMRETIRIGLVGGGADAPSAFKLVARYVDDVPLLANVMLAAEIINAALSRPEGEPADEDDDDDDQKKTMTTMEPDASGSPPSTALAG